MKNKYKYIILECIIEVLLISLIFVLIVLMKSLQSYGYIKVKIGI